MTATSLSVRTEQQFYNKPKCNLPYFESVVLSINNFITLALTSGHYLICPDFNISFKIILTRLGFISIAIRADRYNI